MADKNSAFYIPNALESVIDTLSVSPKYSSDQIAELVDSEFQKRFGSVSGSVGFNASSGSVGKTIEECAVDLVQSAISIATVSSNQLNLDFSTGSFLDAQGSLFALTRHYSIPTRVLCRFYGAKGTSVPEGTVVVDDSGNRFELDTTLTLNEQYSGASSSGSIYCAEGYVSCLDKGEVSVENNSITKIETGIVGLEGVVNESAGETGRDEESDGDYRTRLRKSRYRGTGIVDDVRSRILSTEGVNDCLVYENGTDSTVYVNESGVVYEGSRTSGTSDPAILPHSILVIVDGGKESLVGGAILDADATGAGTTPLYALSGSSAAEKHVIVAAEETVSKYVKSVSVVDSNYGLPYSVTYNMCEEVPYKIKASVYAHKWSGVESDLESLVKDAIDRWQSYNMQRVDGPGIGSTIYPFEISAAISDYIPEIIVKSVSLCEQTSGTKTNMYLITASKQGGASYTVYKDESKSSGSRLYIKLDGTDKYFSFEGDYAYLAKDAAPTVSADYRIGSTGYSTLTAAVNAATDGQTIVVCSSSETITNSSAVNVESNKSITIDLNGHKVSQKANVIIDGELTFCDSVTYGLGGSNGARIYLGTSYHIQVNEGGQLNINGAYVKTKNCNGVSVDGTFTMSSGSLEGLIVAGSGSQILISGGTFTSNSSEYSSTTYPFAIDCLCEYSNSTKTKNSTTTYYELTMSSVPEVTITGGSVIVTGGYVFRMLSVAPDNKNKYYRINMPKENAFKVSGGYFEGIGFGGQYIEMRGGRTNFSSSDCFNTVFVGAASSTAPSDLYSGNTDFDFGIVYAGEFGHLLPLRYYQDTNASINSPSSRTVDSVTYYGYHQGSGNYYYDIPEPSYPEDEERDYYSFSGVLKEGRTFSPVTVALDSTHDGFNLVTSEGTSSLEYSYSSGYGAKWLLDVVEYSWSDVSGSLPVAVYRKARAARDTGMEITIL